MKPLATEPLSFAARLRREETEAANDTAAETGSYASGPPDLSTLEARIEAYNRAMEGEKKAVGKFTERALNAELSRTRALERHQQETERAPEFVIALELARERQQGRGRSL